METIENYTIKLLSNSHYIVENNNGRSVNQSFEIGLPFYGTKRIIKIEPTCATRQYYENMFGFLNEYPPSFEKLEYENFINSDKGKNIIPHLIGLYIDGVIFRNNQWAINLSNPENNEYYLGNQEVAHITLFDNKCWQRMFRDVIMIELTKREYSLVLNYIRISLFKSLLDYPYNTFKGPFIIPNSPFVLDVAQTQGWIK